MRYAMIPQNNGTYTLDVYVLVPPPATDIFSLRIHREETVGAALIVQQDIPLDFYMDATAYGTNYGTIFCAQNIIIEPLPHQLQIYLVVNGVLGGQIQGQFINFAMYQTAQIHFPKSGFTVADFNAAVAANVAASLNAQVVPLQNQITALQAQLSAAGSGNLQPLIDAGLILQPQRRTGAYTIRDFTVLNAIYQAGAPTLFVKRDLDFINIQLLSIRQAVQKMDEVALARAQDPNLTAIYRTRADKRKEYSARINADFVEYLQETTRIMRYAVDEVRYNQKFNLLSPTLVRDLDILP